MMETGANKKNNTQKTEKNPIEAFLYRFIPYWPLFVLLILVALAGAIFYLKLIAKPVYEITANILVDDEKKGADESQLMQALNITSSTIIDNEIEVIRSKELIKNVINELMLYTPIYEEGQIVSHSAYKISPVNIELKKPIVISDSIDQIYFKYSKKAKVVTINGKRYPLNQWVETDFGTARFVKNEHQKVQPTGKLYFQIIDPRAVLDDLYARLLVTSASKLSSVIKLTINDEVPERGEDILNLLIKNYYDAGLNDKNTLASNTLSFVEARIAQVAKELDSIENNMQNFRNERGVINLSEQGQLYLHNAGESDRKLTDINLQLAMLSEVQNYVAQKDGQIGIVPSIATIGQDQQFLSQLLQRLYTAQMQYESLKKTVPQGNPKMLALKEEIDNMRPTILENIQNQRASLLAGKNTLVKDRSKYASMLQSIPKNEKEFLDISRQQAIKNDAYSFLLQKKEETALAYAAMVTNAKTISNANASFVPVSPKKAFVLLAAFALALVAGFAFVNIKESLTNKILFRSDIESITTAPIAAEIMSIKGKEPMFLNDAKSPKQLTCMEQFYQLRFGIGLSNGLLKYRKILVTSASASEGKSFISNNLALSLALSGKKVVLIDFDFRKPKTSSIFELTGTVGLAEYFERSEVKIEDIIYPTTNDELFVIPAGIATTNPTELLFKRDMGELFTYLENQFDFVIMDTAPVDPVIDAFLVSDYSDAILFVIRHGYSTKATLESLQKGQKLNALKNLFIVFNGIKSRGFIKKGYGFGYGYGSSNMYGEKFYHSKKLTKGI